MALTVQGVHLQKETISAPIQGAHLQKEAVVLEGPVILVMPISGLQLNLLEQLKDETTPKFMLMEKSESSFSQYGTNLESGFDDVHGGNQNCRRYGSDTSS